MSPEQHEELKRLGQLGITINFNYDGEEWNVWNGDAMIRIHAWGKPGLEGAVSILIDEIKQIARDILELK